VNLRRFCHDWEIPMTAPEDFNLFFVDSEGTGNTNGVDVDLGKALTVVSSVATVRIIVGQNRLDDDVVDCLKSALKLQCLRTNRESKTELSSAVILMYRDVGLDGDPPESLNEYEQRRRDEDSAGFSTIRSQIPQLGFTPETLLVLLQPQVGDMDGPNPFGEQAYMSSLRDAARFIDGVCRTRRSPGFGWMNSVLTNVASKINRLPGVSPVDIGDTFRLICTQMAEEISQSIIAGGIIQVSAEMDRLSVLNFPFANDADPRFANDAVQRFTTQCDAFSHELLDEIPDKAALLRQNVRESILAEWNRRWTARRAVLIDQIAGNLRNAAQQLILEAGNDAVNDVNGLSFQTALDYANEAPVCDKWINLGTQKLTIAAERIHPRCVVLVPDLFDILKGKLERDVRLKVDPEWRRKKQQAQAWQEAERDRAYQAQLEAQAEEHRQEIIRAQNEARRKQEEDNRKEQQRKAEAERKRKQDRPESLSELKEIKGPSWNPVGETVWLYPGGKAGLRFRVLSSSPTDSRLELVSPSGLVPRKVQVTTRLDESDGSVWWTETACLGYIPFYFDGNTMGIVYSKEVTINTGQAIYIDLPPDTDISNLDWSGVYRHWRPEYGSQQVHMGTVGTYSRGPRLQSDHS
jgi:hypothetical protein